MAKTYEAMQRNNSATDMLPPKSASILQAEFIDLKNTRQIGDLEKKLIHFKRKSNATVFNFVSSRNTEGVSTIILNLAEYMALKKTGKKILLIDANLSSPAIHFFFNTTNEVGLIDALKDIGIVKNCISKSDYIGLDILSCGNIEKSEIKGVDQERFLNLIAAIKKDYDYILIDSAPLLVSSDSLSSAISADITFFVIQSFKTQREVAEKCKQLLEENDCQIGGALLNRDLKIIPQWIYKFL